MRTSERLPRLDLTRNWFERRSYDHAQFADVEGLARRKRDLSRSVSVVLPAREVAGSIGAIVDDIRELNERAALVDQVLVVDADSSDGSATAAAIRGAEVYSENELLPELGPALGKGDAMWRALSVARGDLILYLDADTVDFGPHFVYGMIGPLLVDPEVRFVKAAYNRPWLDTVGAEMDNGGRVTELTARPLLNLFYPELAGFAQPLAGEVGAPRELLVSIPFFTGYAVETGMLIDVVRATGIEAMCQVDLETRTNPNQSLLRLGKMAYEVLRAVERRLREDGRLVTEAELDGYVQATRTPRSLTIDHHEVQLVERPPMATFPTNRH
jgi:glucosyl-3-phosphoglycerate synthase